MLPETPNRTSWLDKPLFSKIRLDWEVIIFIVILIFAVATRFYNLEARVMSHDETSHTYFSWLLFKGQGYAHDPVTHGPLQFHLVALSYFIFGDSDTSARIPAVLFSLATVVFLWQFRRYLGRVGALIAALLFTISPYMLYYSRYVRNEAFVALFGVVSIWAILRYFESGQTRYLYWLTAATILHFTAKETAYIYAAQILLFLALYLIYRIMQREWLKEAYRPRFILTLALSLVLLASAGILHILSAAGKTITDIPVTQTGLSSLNIPPSITVFSFLLGVVALAASIYFVIRGFSLAKIREERAFDLAMLIGTLVLPLLSAFVINALGWKVPINASEVAALTITDMWRMAAIIVPIFILSIVLGFWWNRRQWLINAAIWWGVFIVLYTTMFTNGAGFFTGLVGSLGYWMAQQEVNRGSQPWYYYLLQISIYEYLPAIGSLLAGVLILLRRKRLPGDQWLEVEDQIPVHEPEEPGEKELSNLSLTQPARQGAPTLALLGFWSITSLLAYTIAGEKMPWLTVHITLPFILLASWAIGYLIDTTHWKVFRGYKGWLLLGLLLVFIPALLATLGSLLSANPPFAGKSLEQLANTSTFVISLVAVIASGIGLFYVLRDWALPQIGRVLALVLLMLLSLLTARAAFMASFLHYDLATEYLVYAHCTPGIKIALGQIEDLSKRLTGGLDMVVAYDDKTTYPYWWYLRNYPNQRYFGANPTRDLRDAPAILVGEENFGKIEPIVGQAYYKFEYLRIWWPNQDYFNLTWQRIWDALKDPNMRSALFQIWLNRDFTKYGEATGKDMSLQKWSPTERMRLYLRKDIVAQLWDYGTAPSSETSVADPYEGKGITLNADVIYGTPGTEPGQFKNPRDVAIAPDGTLYVADTNNNRIQHLDAEGNVLQVWGSFADLSKGEAPGGTFYEPWAVAVGLDGSVYVADTWNHRIQKFSADGKFITMWGYFGQGESPDALWGPRDIAVDKQGLLYVTDTGNKRVVIYSPDGQFVNQFGSVGFEPGQFNEPVGVAVSADGLIYVADTWNQRVQVFQVSGSGVFTPLRTWEIVAWYGESLDNKPYIAVDSGGNVFATDPEGYRVFKFNSNGEFSYYWGVYGTDKSSFNLPTGIALDAQGNIWVADSGNNRILRFTPPEK